MLELTSHIICQPLVDFAVLEGALTVLLDALNTRSPHSSSDHISICIIDRFSGRAHFTIRRNTPFDRLIRVATAAWGKDPNSVILAYRGYMLDPAQTPDSVGMSDVDYIYMFCASAITSVRSLCTK